MVGFDESGLIIGYRNKIALEKCRGITLGRGWVRDARKDTTVRNNVVGSFDESGLIIKYNMIVTWRRIKNERKGLKDEAGMDTTVWNNFGGRFDESGVTII